MPVKTKKEKKQPSGRGFYLGVDGGGTKTHAAVINEKNEIVGEGFGGPSNPLRVGVETAVSNIVKAATSACDQANISRTEIINAVLGLAGVRRADIRQRVRESFVTNIRVKQIEVVTDAEIALYATTLGAAGLVIIAGTGSVCLGMNSKGQTAIAGGWGPLAGDEGGGAGIARQALQAVAKASDGRGPATELTVSASEYFRASGPDNLIVAIYSPQVDNLRIAGFARFVVEAAIAGDDVAAGIIADAGSELGSAASAVIGRLGLGKQKFPVGCVGSIFNAGEILKDKIAEKLRSSAPKATLTEPKMSPANAAAIMAKNLT